MALQLVLCRYACVYTLVNHGFMHHLHRLVPLGIAPGDHEALIRQSLDQLPALLAQLVERGDAAGILCALPDLNICLHANQPHADS
jgi:hypothetical protein